MRRGTMVFQVAKRQKGDRFEVEAGRVLVRVVGTVFSVTMHSETDVIRRTTDVLNPGEIVLGFNSPRKDGR